MKHLAERLQLSLAILGMTVFSACTPIVPKPQQNDFFAPVDRVDQKKSTSDTLIRVSERNTATVHNGLNDSLRVLVQQQNKRLGDLMRQLNLLTKKDMGSTVQETDTLDDILSNRNYLSNEMLLEKIRDQNRRLNDVVEQLKLLSRNQQIQREHDTRSVIVPAQPTLVQQVPVLVSGATVVPVRSALAQQSSASRKQQPSFNYGTAIQLYKDQQYGKAIEVFTKLLNQKIEPQLADRYHFWMGVCYFSLQKGIQAINEFKNVLGYNQSEKTEEAYFMIGQCYERMGAKQDAKATYEKMLRLYPRGASSRLLRKN